MRSDSILAANTAAFNSSVLVFKYPSMTSRAELTAWPTFGRSSADKSFKLFIRDVSSPFLPKYLTRISCTSCKALLFFNCSLTAALISSILSVIIVYLLHNKKRTFTPKGRRSRGTTLIMTLLSCNGKTRPAYYNFNRELRRES